MRRRQQPPAKSVAEDDEAPPTLPSSGVFVVADRSRALDVARLRDALLATLEALDDLERRKGAA